MYPLLDTIKDPKDLRGMTAEELSSLSEEIRRFLIQNVAKTGGHLSANLGVVELTIALHYGLLSVREVLEALDRRHPSAEIVITGRYAPQELIDRADLVTEMREIKHYYRQGVRSRDGIDK